MDNTRQLHRIRYRFDAYRKITWNALRNGASLWLILSSRFPYRFSDRDRPSLLNVELTDACDLKCQYCNNPLFANPRTSMSEEIFARLEDELAAYPIDRLLVGGGEPTLHPRFEDYSARLARRVKFLSIVTNGQWRRASTLRALVEHYDMIEVSVDAGGRENYERSRVGASYERLVDNLRELRRMRDESSSRALINLRFMVRPSTDAGRRRELAFWRRYADSVMPQYVIRHMLSDYSSDVYHSVHVTDDRVPRCTLPFRNLQVRVNGDVPMCATNGSHLDPAKRVILGNVGRDSLRALWTGERLAGIRRAHRDRRLDALPMCRGCRGC